MPGVLWTCWHGGCLLGAVSARQPMLAAIGLEEKLRDIDLDLQAVGRETLTSKSSSRNILPPKGPCLLILSNSSHFFCV